MPLTLPVDEWVVDTDGLIDTEEHPVELCEPEELGVVQAVGDAEKEAEDDTVEVIVPDPEPHMLGDTEPEDEPLPDTLGVPLTLPLTVTVPEEEDDTEPLALGDWVTVPLEHPELVLDDDPDVEWDGLCVALWVPLAQLDAVTDGVELDDTVDEEQPLVLGEGVTEPVEQPDGVPDGELLELTEAL